MTRASAKSAALSGTDTASDPPKKAVLAAKKTTTVLGAATTGTRKRSALNDVSNVTKNDGPGAGTKGGKKPLATKGSVAQAANPTKIQKVSSSRTTTTRKPASADLKRGPGSGIGGHATKKRNISQDSKSVLKEDPEEPENVAPPQLVNRLEVGEVKVTKDVGVIQKPLAVVAEEPVEVWDDLDTEDADDPLMVSEYVVEIFEYLKQLEITTMANPDYMDNQNELEWKMRGILVDWLLEVHTRFRLLPETLFLAVNIIDRFLSAKVVQLDRLQLVGVTAMFIASKYEEVLSPHVQNFRHVADDGFTEDEILSAERFVLAALNYDLSYPNPMNFLRRISKADNYDIQTRTLGKYLLEISCLDHRFIAHPPSQVAAAAMFLARMVLDKGEWVCVLFRSLLSVAY